VPALESAFGQLEGTGEREISTTMAFVRMLTILCATRSIGKHIVPIVPDEARTFGMEGCSASSASTPPWASSTRPQDADQLMYYKEDKNGQILEEGINEAGAMCSGSPRPPPTPTTACR
jgi:pyruvate dehydrogenase E1 component